MDATTSYFPARKRVKVFAFVGDSNKYYVFHIFNKQKSVYHTDSAAICREGGLYSNV